MADVPTFTDDHPIDLDIHPLRVWCNEEEQYDWEGDTFDLVCCDCGLTHNVAVIRDTQTEQIRILMHGNAASTAQYRRYKRGTLHKINGKWRLIRNG